MKKVQEGFIKEVEKIWGKEFWVVNNEKYCMKFLFIEPGGMCSLHWHRRKDETFFIDEGSCFLEILEISTPVEGSPGTHNETQYELSHGDSFRITPGVVHRFWVPKDAVAGCMVVEVSTTHDDSDVVRLENSKRLE